MVSKKKLNSWTVSVTEAVFFMKLKPEISVIIQFFNAERQGVVFASEKGLKHSTGKYIARTDADDGIKNYSIASHNVILSHFLLLL